MTRNQIICWTLFAVASLAPRAFGSEQPLNVLMIAVDDLNDWVGFLDGHPQVKTPHMDRLAARGVVFENAQCAISLCNPSRVALMSGIAPHVSGVYTNQDVMRSNPVLKDAVTLPQYFRHHGYTSLARGKIFHTSTGERADPQSWDILSSEWNDRIRVPQDQRTDMEPYRDVHVRRAISTGGPPSMSWEATMQPRELTTDYQNALWTAKWLTNSASEKTPQPFFLACGIFRPHLPWKVPAEYFARFDLDSIQLPPIKDDDLEDIQGQLPTKEYRYVKEHGLRREVVRAYLASCAYVDDCIGVLLNALDKSPYRDNTVIVFYSDHGWHVGEKHRYHKLTHWEEAARVPLIICAPGVKPGRTSRPVSLIDLYPTLVDLAGLPEKPGLSGRSIAPLLKDPGVPWDYPALTTTGAGSYSLRTERWRYAIRKGGREELYDHDTDPHEWINLADNPEFESTKRRLRKHLPRENASLKASDAGSNDGHQPSAEYLALRKRATASLERLRALTEHARQTGIETSREHVTIVTAEQFLKFAAWDFENPDELTGTCSTYHRINRKQAERYCRQLPLRELREVRVIADAALDELKAVMEGKQARREVPVIDVARLQRVNDYFHFDGRPLFPSGFFWLPNEPDLREAYGTIGSAFVTPAQKRSYDATARFNTQGWDPDAQLGYVYLDHDTLPKWAELAYHNIRFAKRVFMASDIDHPGTRDLWKNLLADVVPQLAGRNITRGGYMLANEPRWFTQIGEWDTGPVSAFTMAKFRVWLSRQHGNVRRLNQRWGTSFASIDQVTIDIPMDPKLRGTAVWYDWCRFNMDRVTAFFAFMKNEITKHDSAAAVHIKLMPEHFTTAPRSHGIDMEQMVRLQDIVGCDAKVVNKSRSREPEVWTKRYAIHWHEVAISFDFFKSLAPDKMIFDSEFHGMSTVPWRDEQLSAAHMRCALWLSHLHGMGMNLTWFWGRDEQGAPIKQTARDFYASSLTHPAAMNAYGRTMKDLNAFAPEFASLARQRKHVRLFYSETEAITAEDYIYDLERAYQALYHMGIPLGFATGQMLQEAESNLPDGTAFEESLVIVRHATHVTKSELEGLNRYVSRGGNLLIVGDGNLTRDPYGRPHNRLLSEKGTRIRHVGGSEMIVAVKRFVADAALAPPIVLKEENSGEEPACVWRTAAADDGYVLLVINLGLEKASLRIERLNEARQAITVRNMITGSTAPNQFDLKSLDAALLYVH